MSVDIPARAKIVLSAIAAVALCASCGNNPLAHSTEPIGEADLAVALGTAAPNLYGYVVGLTRGDDTNFNVFCSGVLITPTWVLTASHCINGKTKDCLPGSTDPVPQPNVKYRAFFDGNPTSGTPLNRIFDHTFTTSGAVPTLNPNYQDECSYNDASRDLALIKLDRRVPSTIATPLHVAEGLVTCRDIVAEDDFSATVVGYGKTVFLGSQPALKFRNYSDSDGWELFDEDDGQRYSNYWDMPPISYPNFWYEGILEGDSGGALVPDNELVLCGINSRYYPTTSGIPFFIPQLGSDTAAVDSPAAIEFFSDKIYDSMGRFMGECDQGDPALRDLDTDDDLIPDACDACPHVLIANYDLAGGPDSDADGVPDACDNCPMIANADQADPDADGLGSACDSCSLSNVPAISGALNGASDITCCNTDVDCKDVPSNRNRCIAITASERAIIQSDGLPATSWGALCASGNGRCEADVDSDNDGAGDLCDNCPLTFNPDDSDIDLDGVGDACDNCPGGPGGPQPADANVLCTFTKADSFTVCAITEPGSVCVPPHLLPVGTFSAPRCSKVADGDDDGIGNVCDNCSGEANPFEGPGTQPNCNLDSEIFESIPYPFVGDACDPVPCAKLDAWVAASPLAVPCNLPPENCPPPTDDDFMKIAVTANLLPWNSGGYGIVSVPTETVGFRLCSCQTLLGGGSTITAQTCQSVCSLDSVAEYNNALTNWHVIQVSESADGVSNAPDPSLASFAPGAEFGGVGVVDPIPGDSLPVGYASKDSMTFFADWDVGSVLITQQRLLWSHVPLVSGLVAGILPSAYQGRSNNYLPGLFGTGPALPSPNGLILIEAGIWDHIGGCPQCNLFFDIANIVVDPFDGNVKLHGSWHDVDLTPMLAAEVATSLHGTGRTWAPVAESAEWLRPDAPRLAALWSDGGSIDVVVASRQGELESIVGEALSGGAQPQKAIPLARLDFQPVLSGMEAALYIVGGKTAAGVLTQDVLRFDVRKGQWRKLALTGASPESVLAATYRPEERALYVVDEKVDAEVLIARILRIDIGTLSSTVLGAWPRDVAQDRVWLRNAYGGRLFLASSSSAAETWVGVLLDVGPGGALTEGVGVAGVGVMSSSPNWTKRALTLPTWRGGSFVGEVRSNAAIGSGSARTIGDCL